MAEKEAQLATNQERLADFAPSPDAQAHGELWLMVNDGQSWSVESIDFK